MGEDVKLADVRLGDQLTFGLYHVCCLGGQTRQVAEHEGYPVVHCLSVKRSVHWLQDFADRNGVLAGVTLYERKTATPQGALIVDDPLAHQSVIGFGSPLHRFIMAFDDNGDRLELLTGVDCMSMRAVCECRDPSGKGPKLLPDGSAFAIENKPFARLRLHRSANAVVRAYWNEFVSAQRKAGSLVQFES